MANLVATINESCQATDKVDAKIRAALENRYYKLSYRFLSEAMEADRNTPNEISTELDSSLLSILCAAFCIEAFLNNLCREFLGDKGVDKYLNQNSKQRAIKKKGKGVIKEIAELMGLALTKKFLEAKFWDGFTRLFELRDKLVHYKKGFEMSIETKWGNTAPIYSEINYQEAKIHVQAMDEIIDEFCKVCKISNPFMNQVIQVVNQNITGRSNIIK